MMTLKHYDKAIEAVRKPTHDDVVNEMLEQIAVMLQTFRSSHEQLINELLNMYMSASEHGVDISRHAIYDLAKRLSG